MDVVVWLRSLGLGKHEAAFRENDIDELSNIPGPSVQRIGRVSRQSLPALATFDAAG